MIHEMTWEGFEERFPLGNVDPAEISEWFATKQVKEKVFLVTRSICIMRRINNRFFQDLQQEVYLILHQLIADPVFRERYRHLSSASEALNRAADAKIKHLLETGLIDGITGATVARRKSQSARRTSRENPQLSNTQVIELHNQNHKVQIKATDLSNFTAVDNAYFETASDTENSTDAHQSSLLIVTQIHRIVDAMFILGHISTSEIAEHTNLSKGRVQSLIPLAVEIIKAATAEDDD